MRPSTILAAILLTAAGGAHAHALTGEVPLALKLAHQLMSPHHLPLLVVVLLAGVGLLVVLGRRLTTGNARHRRKRRSPH